MMSMVGPIDIIMSYYIMIYYYNYDVYGRAAVSIPALQGALRYSCSGVTVIVVPHVCARVSLLLSSPMCAPHMVGERSHGVVLKE